MTSKKDLILALHAKGKTTRQIALDVYGRKLGRAEIRVKSAYVRVVLNQRKGGGCSEYDRRYMENSGRDRQKIRHQERYATDPGYRARHRASASAWRQRNRDRHLASQRAYNKRRRIADSQTTV